MGKTPRKDTDTHGIEKIRVTLVGPTYCLWFAMENVRIWWKTCVPKVSTNRRCSKPGTPYVESVCPDLKMI